MAEGQEQKSSLAFSFAKKKVVQKVAVNVEERKDTGQLITGFDGDKVQIVGGGSGSDNKTYVIPKLENTFKTGLGPKKFTPTFKPPSNDVVTVKEGEDKFVQAASTVPVITEYGLQLREAKPVDRADTAAAAEGAANGSLPPALREERAFREALEELPDVADIETYESMPVEQFGAAMLRGMGWEEGMGVGRNRRKVDAIEYVRRPERLGLGAQPVLLGQDTTKPVKMGDKPRKQDLVLAPDADGRQRNIRKLDEQLVPRSAVLPGPQPGKVMRITAGPHAGLACTALGALPNVEGQAERWRVRLSASQEEVEVLASELGERWEREGGQEAGEGAAATAAADGGRDNTEAAESRMEQEGDRGRDRGGEDGRERVGDKLRQLDDGQDERRWSAEEDARGAKHARVSDCDRDRPDRHHDRERERGREQERERGREMDWEPHGGRRAERSRDDDSQERASKKHHHHEHRKEHKKEHKKEKHKEKRDKHDKKDKYDRRAEDERQEKEDDSDGGGGGERAGPTWLFPNIKVRIVDKRVRGGKLYLKKGAVVDVHPGATADVAVDDTGDVLRLPQSALETVVPRHEGAPVLIVTGRHKGARGRLLQASTSAGAAAVQLAGDFSIVRLMLDDVAAYVGELEEE